MASKILPNRMEYEHIKGLYEPLQEVLIRLRAKSGTRSVGVGTKKYY